MPTLNSKSNYNVTPSPFICRWCNETYGNNENLDHTEDGFPNELELYKETYPAPGYMDHWQPYVA